jgi:hypothetical protein
MFEEMIEHIIPHLRRDIQVYFDSYRGIRNYFNRRGEVGERFIGRTMKYVLMQYGFRWGEEPCHFTITSHYPREGANEVDFRVDIFDSEGSPHIFYVESKNYLDHWAMTPARFRFNILHKFTINDPNHEGLWMVTLNNVHREQIRELCHANDIEIIPLDVILTTTATQTTPPTVEEFTRAMRAFSIRFMELIQGQLDGYNCRIQAPGELREYLQRGVPELDICSRFGVSMLYLQRVKSMMRAEGISLGPDGRTKAGRAIRKKMKDL